MTKMHNTSVIATAIFDKAFLQPGEKTELYILRDKLYQERESRVTKRPSLINEWQKSNFSIFTWGILFSVGLGMGFL